MDKRPLSLPDVTVVAIDAVESALLKLALDDTLREIEPANVLVFDDPDLDSLDAVARCLWYEVPTRVQTSHFLIVQWDGWVLDGERWDDRWLQADYAGAPWPWHHDHLDVGNGGFSLRSTELARWVACNPGRYPLSYPEDVALCRKHRLELELVEGFSWASLEQAERFSFERGPPRPTFGFHGAWNWPCVLGHDKLLERVAQAGAHARGKVEWQQLMKVLRSVPSSSPLTRTP